MTFSIVSHGLASAGIKEVSNWITLLNEYWGNVSFIRFLHHWENVIFSLFAAFLLISVSFLATRKKSLVPAPLQNVVELAVESLDNLVTGIIGPKGRAHTPFIGTLFFFILIQNFMGLVPGLKAPTSSLNTTVALAVCVFFYVQWTGIRENGILGYLDHLMGSPRDVVGWIMVPLFLPLHIMEEFIKPVSLSFRLFGNILGEDALIGAVVVLSLATVSFMKSPVGLPLQFPFMLLSVLLGTIQALVFSLLSTIYISLMLPHHEYEAEHAVRPAHHG